MVKSKRMKMGTGYVLGGYDMRMLEVVHFTAN
jgi:hypothetical protein